MVAESSASPTAPVQSPRPFNKRAAKEQLAITHLLLRECYRSSFAGRPAARGLATLTFSVVAGETSTWVVQSELSRVSPALADEEFLECVASSPYSVVFSELPVGATGVLIEEDLMFSGDDEVVTSRGMAYSLQRADEPLVVP